MTSLSLITFGMPRVLRDGEPVNIPLRKGLALLVYLAEMRAPVARDALATLLWPESDAGSSRANLRRLIYNVEVALGGKVFAADRHTVGLVAGLDLTIDSAAFEAACDAADYAQALQIQEAEYLSGFSLPGCSEFDDWVYFRREALRSRLVHALERLTQDRLAAGDTRAAVAPALRLVAFDPYSDANMRHLIAALLGSGDRPTAERHFAAFHARLADDLSVAPEPATRALFDPQTNGPFDSGVHYVNSSGVHLAWRAIGTGAIDILLMPGFVSHVERVTDHPLCRSFIEALLPYGRVLLFDRRGIGLSDRIGAAPSVDVTARDIAAVLAAAGSRQVVLFGASESGPACIRFAVDHRAQVAGMILFGALARGAWAADYPHVLRAEQYDRWYARLAADWGGPAGLDVFAPSLQDDPFTRSWWASMLRLAASPGSLRSVLEALRDSDVRALLPTVRTPTLVLHRRGDEAVRFAAGESLARSIAGARFVPLDGRDHWFFAGDQRPVRDAIGDFLGRLGSLPRQ